MNSLSRDPLQYALPYPASQLLFILNGVVLASRVLRPYQNSGGSSRQSDKVSGCLLVRVILWSLWANCKTPETSACY